MQSARSSSNHGQVASEQRALASCRTRAQSLNPLFADIQLFSGSSYPNTSFAHDCCLPPKCVHGHSCPWPDQCPNTNEIWPLWFKGLKHDANFSLHSPEKGSRIRLRFMKRCFQGRHPGYSPSPVVSMQFSARPSHNLPSHCFSKRC